MPPSTINADKELALTYQPLLLAEGILVDGTEIFLATHAVTYSGNVHLPRIEEQQIDAIQQLGPQGIEAPAKISLRLKDGDLFLYQNYVNTVGFSGGSWVLRFVLWEPGTSNFSNSVVKFYGVSNEAEEPDDSGLMTLEMSSKLDFQRVIFPPVKNQKRCPHFFPKTAAERQAAADDSSSRFFPCGYSPDASGGEARGNYETGVTPFPTCDRTYGHCIARLGDSGALVQIQQDESARATGNFGGIQNDPPDVISRAPKSAYERVQGSDSRELGSADSPIPLVYGRQWVRGIPTSQAADANITGQECVLSYGQTGDFLRMVVNGVEIPRSGSGRDSLDAGFWGAVNDGKRRGSVNVVSLWTNSPRLDPYGSIATAVVVVPRQLAEAGEAMAADVLIQGRIVRVYTDPSTFSTIFSENPVWILMDMIVLSGQLNYSDFKIASWITAATFCATTITAPNLTKELGGPDTLTHARFKAAFTIRDTRSLADIVRGLRNAARLDVRMDDAGLIDIRVLQTLAGQQPSAVAGSNFDTAIRSKSASGSTVNGFAAYKFDESNILEKSNGELAISRSVEKIRDAENSYHARFQNEYRAYTEDSVQIYEDVAVATAGKINATTAPILGPVNYDQHLRTIRTLLARRFRGNPQDLPIGTWSFDIETTIKGSHLKVNDIVLLDVQKYNLDAGLLTGADESLDGCLCRVTKISPATNYRKAKFTLEWHSDDWYVDTFGQEDEPAFTKSRRDRPKRPPHPWQGYETQPSSGDALYDESEYFFGIAQRYEVSSDGTALARIKLVGELPVNFTSNKVGIPSVPIDGSVDGGGGSIPGDQTVWIGLTALDADGNEGSLSELVKTDLPAGVNFAVDIPDVVIPPATGYVCYTGTDPRLLTFNHTSASSPSTIKVTDLNVQHYGPPDTAFERLKVRAKIVEHAGVLGVQISSLAATTITVIDALWTTDEWAGRIISFLGFEDDENLIPILHFAIISNTSDTLTFSGVDLVALGIEALDVMTIRSQPTAATANTYTDSKWFNSLATMDSELPLDIISIADVGGEAEIETAAAHGYTTGDKLRVTGVVAGLKGVWTITVTTTQKFTLDGSTYAPGPLGQVRKLANGLTPGEEIGRLARIIAGPGRGTVRKIIANTETQITIDGDWGLTDPNDLLDSTIIIEQANWSTEAESSPISNRSRGITTELEIPIENLLRRILLVEPVGVNREGKESIAALSQEREIFVFGARRLGRQQIVYGAIEYTLFFGLYASYQGPSNNIAGDVLVFIAGNNRFYETPYTHAVFNGLTWDIYRHQWRMRPLDPTGFSWNTGSDVDSEIGGATTFTITPGTALKFFGKTAPATPYTIVATLMVESWDATLKVGLGWKDSSTGEIEHSCYVPSVAEFIGGERWTDLNTPAGVWVSRQADLIAERVVQIIITNNGTTRTGHYRFEGRPSAGTGILGQGGYSRPVGDFLDEDEVGLTFYNDRTVIPGQDDGEVDVTVLSWEEFPEIVT